MAVRFTVRLARGARPVRVTIDDGDGRRQTLALSTEESGWLGDHLQRATYRAMVKLRAPAKAGTKGGRAT